MHEDARARLSATIASTEPEAPVQALGHAIAWAAQALADIGQDDVLAFRCAVALDEALSSLTGLFALVPGVIELAAPGAEVVSQIAARQAALDRLRAKLTCDRATLEASAEVERQLADAKAEHENLRARIAQLKHAQAVAGELPALRAVLADLEAELGDAEGNAVEGSASAVLERLESAIAKILRLSDEQQALLAPGLADMIADAAQAADDVAAARARVDEITNELAARLAEAEQLKQEYDRRLPALEQYRRADSELAVGLSGAAAEPASPALDAVHAALGGIERQLVEVDAQLRPLLQRHADTYEGAMAVRGW